MEECEEDIDGNDMVCNTTLYYYGKVCRSCAWYIMLLIIVL